MLAALGPMAFALALLAFMPNLWTTALMLFGCSSRTTSTSRRIGPLPDLLPDNVFGRAQGVQHVFRGVAIAGGLIGGGFLFHLWRPAPFLVAAFVVSVACAVPILLVTEDGGHGRVFEGVRAYVAQSWRVLRSNRDVATFLVANTAWEGTSPGRGRSSSSTSRSAWARPLVTSTYILGAVAGGYIVAALIAGPIGGPGGPRPRDHGRVRRLRLRAARGRARDRVARLVPRADLRRRDRRRDRDDPRLGAPLQADARW
jgi:hypothetical protein